jgi:short-subunit dehydrogenase
MSLSPQNILITGASSGLGAALALEYAKTGIVLTLIARDEARLKAVQKKCQDKGAIVHILAADVRARAEIKDFILKVDTENPIDLVIANAGISGGTSFEKNQDAFYEIMEINVMGVLNSILPLIAPMQKRQRGQIALISSLAGLRGLPNAIAYSTSKCAVTALGDALRPALKKEKITVSTIHPGFIKTPLTDQNNFKMPFLMPADGAAQIIKNVLAKGKTKIAFPWPLYIATQVTALLPRFIGDFILSKAPKK